MLGFQGDAESPELDPIRIQKGMFLLSQEGGLATEERYDFDAHFWGPYSREVKNDLEQLVRDGYVQARPVPGYSWNKYALTAAGVDHAREVLPHVPAEQAHAVVNIKRTVTGASFRGLLDDVYSRYPDYAVNSLFRSA